MERNEKLIILQETKKYIDYLLNSMCSRELPLQGREFLNKEYQRVKNQIDYELRTFDK
jgi:hypothetical protein